jgi:HEAT repeat protein
MAEMKIKRGEAEVREKINPESEDVRVAAVYALKSLEAVSSRGTLAEKLQKENMETDSRFIEALLVTLGEFKAVELMPLVKEKVESNATAQSVREKMVLYLGQISSPESTALLLKIYNDEEEEVIIRSYAVNSLAKLGAKEAAPDIKKVLSAIDSLPFKKKQAYYNLSLYSTAALVKLGDPDAMPRLMDAMKSDSASVRLRSVELMKEMKDKRTIDILKYKMEYDSDARVRKAAGEALKQMGVEVEKKDDKKAGSDKKASPEKPYRPQDLKKETETKDENPASPGSDETPDSVKGDQKKNTGRPGSAARPAR